jgi:hypothetical protein
MSILCGTVAVCLLCSLGLKARQSDSSASDNTNLSAASQPAAGAVPRLIKFTGVVKDSTGKVPTGVVCLSFSLYELPEGGSPLWVETQDLQFDSLGRYTVLLGASSPGGLPLDLFTSGKALWLGVQPQLPGQPEQARVLLVAVPYALKASDADTLGGKPASAFVTTDTVVGASGSTPTPATTSGQGQALIVGLQSENATPSSPSTVGGSGALNFLPIWTSGSTLGTSTLFELDGKVGIGNINPAGTLDVSGQAFIRGGLELPASGAASAAGGALSNPLDLQASAFNSGTNSPEPQLFRWQAEPVGNDTTSPSGKLSLLFGSGGVNPLAPAVGGQSSAGVSPNASGGFQASGPLAETGLSIAGNGLITFAPGQTFPGGGTITGVTAGTDLTGGGTTGTVTLSLDTTKVPTLGATSNTFTGSIAASAFAGNGSFLTNLNPANLSAGTAGISITGNAATATTATTATSAATAASAATATSAATASNALALGGVVAGDYARLDIGNSFTGNQSVSGNVSATGSVSGAAASFTGALSGTTAAFSGALTAAGAALPAKGTATATQAFTSNPMDLLASAFNSGTSAAVPQLFRWQAEPAGNNTASPSATLNLLHLSGSGTPAETGLSIAGNGLITFASGQTFPGGGGGTITGVTAGTDLTGGGTTGTVTLNLDTTKVPTLAAGSNTFAGGITASFFAGNGFFLANLNPANLSAGTAGINISGSAATATTAATANNTLALGGVGAGDYARLDIGNTFTGNQSVTGNVSATGSISGATASFTGPLSATTAAFSGALTAAGAALPAQGTATATQAFTSNPMDLLASTFDSGTSAAVPQLFRWQAEPVGNNSTTPTATLNLLYLSGGGTPAETGLVIANTGQIIFAPGQLFPGTGAGTITGVTAGTDLTGGGTTGTVTLNLDTTKIPTLAAASNTFTGNISALSFTGNGSSLTNVNAVTLNGLTPAAFQPAGLYATLGSNTFAAKQTINTGDVSVNNGNVDLPQTTTTGEGPAVGAVTIGGAPFMHACCSATQYNTFLGASAGFSVSSGSANTGIGFQALQSPSAGSNNTATGYDALFKNTGSGNTANGYDALANNSTGQPNTATGSNALLGNTTGQNNVGMGAGVLQFNDKGSNNVAMGNCALYNTTVSGGSGTCSTSLTGTADNNTAMGTLAGYTNSTGNLNTFVGFAADAASGYPNLTNAAAIGANAKVILSNSLVLGCSTNQGTCPSGTSAPNVGIGTTGPLHTIDAEGANSSLWFDGNGATPGILTVYGGGGSNAEVALFNSTGGEDILVGQASSTKVFRVSVTGEVFADGGYQSTGADFAESVAVKGERSQYEPGDVLEIDPAADRHLALSHHAYSTLVAGIYSTKPGILATPRAMDDPEIQASEVPLAVVGIVPCKVTAENGAIARGDLLVASSRPGYAMKGTDRSQMLGAVVGKALQPLQQGTGVIQVLVTLQ